MPGRTHSHSSEPSCNPRTSHAVGGSRRGPTRPGACVRRRGRVNARDRRAHDRRHLRFPARARLGAASHPPANPLRNVSGAGDPLRQRKTLTCTHARLTRRTRRRHVAERMRRSDSRRKPSCLGTESALLMMIQQALSTLAAPIPYTQNGKWSECNGCDRRTHGSVQNFRH